MNLMGWDGMLIDSTAQALAFSIPEDKRRKFASLRENILSKNVCHTFTIFAKVDEKVHIVSLAGHPGCKKLDLHN